MPITSQSDSLSHSLASKLRADKWRRQALSLRSRRPDWNAVRIAREIQKTPHGKRIGGTLTYSIAAILKHTRKAIA